MRPRSHEGPPLVSAQGEVVLYAPSTPTTVNDHRSSHDRSRLARSFPLHDPFPLHERPVPSPVLDDALLGSEWRWDGDEERSTPAAAR